MRYTTLEVIREATDVEPDIEVVANWRPGASSANVLTAIRIGEGLGPTVKVGQFDGRRDLKDLSADVYRRI